MRKEKLTGGEPAGTPSLEEGRERPLTATEYYHLGNDLRRRGDYPGAMNAYLEAIALDPDSPAVHAKQLLDDIMNFYNKDAYNP